MNQSEAMSSSPENSHGMCQGITKTGRRCKKVSSSDGYCLRFHRDQASANHERPVKDSLILASSSSVSLVQPKASVATTDYQAAQKLSLFQKAAWDGSKSAGHENTWIRTGQSTASPQIAAAQAEFPGNPTFLIDQSWPIPVSLKKCSAETLDPSPDERTGVLSHERSTEDPLASGDLPACNFSSSSENGGDTIGSKLDSLGNGTTTKVYVQGDVEGAESIRGLAHLNCSHGLGNGKRRKRAAKGGNRKRIRQDRSITSTEGENCCSAKPVHTEANEEMSDGPVPSFEADFTAWVAATGDWCLDPGTPECLNHTEMKKEGEDYKVGTEPQLHPEGCTEPESHPKYEQGMGPTHAIPQTFSTIRFPPISDRASAMSSPLYISPTATAPRSCDESATELDDIHANESFNNYDNTQSATEALARTVKKVNTFTDRRDSFSPANSILPHEHSAETTAVALNTGQAGSIENPTADIFPIFASSTLQHYFCSDDRNLFSTFSAYAPTTTPALSLLSITMEQETQALEQLPRGLNRAGKLAQSLQALDHVALLLETIVQPELEEAGLAAESAGENEGDGPFEALTQFWVTVGDVARLRGMVGLWMEGGKVVA